MTPRSEQPVLPGWIIKVIVTAILGVLITGASTWSMHMGAKSNDHDKRIAVVEEQQQTINKSLDEIKAMQRTQAEDTKRILERLPRR